MGVRREGAGVRDQVGEGGEEFDPQEGNQAGGREVRDKKSVETRKYTF